MTPQQIVAKLKELVLAYRSSDYSYVADADGGYITEREFTADQIADGIDDLIREIENTPA